VSGFRNRTGSSGNERDRAGSQRRKLKTETCRAEVGTKAEGGKTLSRRSSAAAGRRRGTQRDWIWIWFRRERTSSPKNHLRDLCTTELLTFNLARFSEDFSHRGRWVTQGLGFQSWFLSVPPRPLRETNILALAPQYTIVVAVSPRCDLLFKFSYSPHRHSFLIFLDTTPPRELLKRRDRARSSGNWKPKTEDRKLKTDSKSVSAW